MSGSARKINLLLLTDCLADLAGGAEKQIFELAKGMDKSRYDVTIASLDCYGRAPRSVIEPVCRLEIFRVVRIYGLSGFLQGLRFFRYLKDSRVDIVQTYHFSSDIWGAFLAWLAGVPVILSNRRDMGFWRKSWHVWAYRLINRWVLRIVVNARPIKAMVLESERMGDDRVVVISNGVELSAKSSPLGRSDLGLNAGDMVVAHVANLRPVKGHMHLIRAFKDVVARCPSAKLVLIGQDELGGSLQKLASDLGISERVLFLGKRMDVSRILPLADVCVLPSLSEGMSNSILEYMAAGKPVVATRVGGNPELIEDGVNGILVEKENVPQLADALFRLLQDPSLRREMGNSGFQRITEEFTMGAMVRKYEQLFETLLAAQRPGISR
ncbi:MAG: glycosyltransferase [Candidatus Omnitrophota bacterium]|nr:glycosyltransferase [Candidatus Omnitrophota bacterium]MDZ4241681.1 glycosyltransferase [Candidatus Omnitrophota bacterium]